MRTNRFICSIVVVLQAHIVGFIYVDFVAETCRLRVVNYGGAELRLNDAAYCVATLILTRYN